MLYVHRFSKIRFSSLCCIFLLSGLCQADTTLQVFKNIEQYKSTEGNSVRLSKLKQGCKIEVIFFGEIGRTKENYLFQQQQLNYAARYEYTYTNGGLTNLSENKGKFKTQQKRIELNPKDSQTLADFREYRSLFSLPELKKCR